MTEIGLSNSWAKTVSSSNQAFQHSHDASVITTGTLTVARGGTGTTTSTGTGSVVLSAGPTLTNTVFADTINANLNDTSNAPSYSWSNDGNTGMYHAATDSIGFACGGGTVVTLSQSNVGVNGWVKQSNHLYFHGEDQLIGAEGGSYPNFRQGPSTYTLILTAVTNTGGMFNSGQNTRVTFPIAGLYQIYLNVPMNSYAGTSYSQCQVYNQAGTLQRTYKELILTGGAGRLTGTIKVNANDYATFSIYFPSSSDYCRINYLFTNYSPYVTVSLLTAI